LVYKEPVHNFVDFLLILKNLLAADDVYRDRSEDLLLN